MKKLFSVILALILPLSLFAGCGGGDKTPPDEPVLPTEDGGVTYAKSDYYPIVATPITLEASIQEAPGIESFTLWEEIREITGITLDLRIISSDAGESVKLMYASRDYPDVTFFTLSATVLINAAIESGDFLEITDELLSDYCPEWAEKYKQYPDIINRIKYKDGKIYSFPNYLMAQNAIDLRDCWMINGDWLDELGMNMPTHINDFTDYLRAVKKAAGTGSIPSNVIPLFTRDNSQSWNIGVWYTIADSFGLYNGLFDEIIVNGVVKSNLQDPLLKDVSKYMRQLYSEGLMNTDYNRVTWAKYQETIDYFGTSTNTWNVGSFFGWDNRGQSFMVYMAPLQTDSGYPPTVRPTGADSRVLRHSYLIFKDNPYPVASLRLVNWFATEYGTLRSRLGEKDIFWEEDGEGGYIVIAEPKAAASDPQGYYDNMPVLLTPELYDSLYRKNYETETSREWAFKNLYQQYVPENHEVFTSVSPYLDYLTDDERAIVTSITTLLNAEMRARTYKWFSGQADIDADWDDFQKKLADLGINQMLDLLQQAYNRCISS